LGAIGLWKQYKQNPETAINNYINTLHLGGTQTLPELFRTAGLQFNFSPEYISQLMLFVKKEMDSL
jgi:oligoendopeptidase F